MHCWIPTVSWHLIGQAVSIYVQTNRWVNWAQICWANSLWASTGLINYWAHSTEFPPFLDLLLVEQFPFIFRQTADLIELRLDEQTYWGPSPAWLTFGHAPLNFHCFLPLNGQAVSGNFQIHHWSDWDQIWWTNLLWACPGLINFWPCSTQFPLFPGLWLVKQFPYICRQTPDWIELKFGGQTHHWPSLAWLTHWGQVTHICGSKLSIIGSDNGLSPGQRQAIIWTNAGILLIGPWGTNFSEILIGIQTFSFKKIHLKMSSAKWRPFCLGLNVLTFGHTTLNFHHFLASDWWSSFLPFSDKPLILLRWNWMSRLIGGLPLPD